MKSIKFKDEHHTEVLTFSFFTTDQEHLKSIEPLDTNITSELNLVELCTMIWKEILGCCFVSVEGTRKYNL